MGLSMARRPCRFGLADERPSRAERKQDEHALLREILADHESREPRVSAWSERTGKPERAFYRRLAEMQ